MNKLETYRYLTERGVSYEVTEHQAVCCMEELGSVELPYPEWDAKNHLFETTRSASTT